jgi:hypothetical protein
LGSGAGLSIFSDFSTFGGATFLGASFLGASFFTTTCLATAFLGAVFFVAFGAAFFIFFGAIFLALTGAAFFDFTLEADFALADAFFAAFWDDFLFLAIIGTPFGKKMRKIMRSPTKTKNIVQLIP